MTSEQRVVVVDGISETAEVLRAILEPRGLRVERVRAGAATIAGSADGDPSLPPHVVVVDGDDSQGRRLVLECWEQVPQVIIGSTHLRDDAAETSETQYLSKPFQYGELIQAIERLLVDGARARCA